MEVRERVNCVCVSESVCVRECVDITHDTHHGKLRRDTTARIVLHWESVNDGALEDEICNLNGSTAAVVIVAAVHCAGALLQILSQTTHNEIIHQSVRWCKGHVIVCV